MTSACLSAFETVASRRTEHKAAGEQKHLCHISGEDNRTMKIDSIAAVPIAGFQWPLPLARVTELHKKHRVTRASLLLCVEHLALILRPVATVYCGVIRCVGK